LKINFACGKQTWPGFFCIDAARNPKATRDPDLLHVVEFDDGAIRPMPLPDGCADELHSYHFVEHVYAWEAPALVAEWQRLLKPGGLLVIECPDIEKAARNLLAGRNDQMVMWPLYGDPQHRDPFMCHRWGYTPRTLQALVEAAGFVKVRQMEPRSHGPRPDRDMRLEARKR
jgi:predicted SAM-dependent methyltransferase